MAAVVDKEPEIVDESDGDERGTAGREEDRERVDEADAEAEAADAPLVAGEDLRVADLDVVLGAQLAEGGGFVLRRGHRRRNRHPRRSLRR